MISIYLSSGPNEPAFKLIFRQRAYCCSCYCICCCRGLLSCPCGWHCQPLSLPRPPSFNPSLLPAHCFAVLCGGKLSCNFRSLLPHPSLASNRHWNPSAIVIAPACSPPSALDRLWSMHRLNWQMANYLILFEFNLAWQKVMQLGKVKKQSMAKQSVWSDAPQNTLYGIDTLQPLPNVTLLHCLHI